MGGIPLVALAGQQPQIENPFDKANHLAVLAGNQLLNQQRQQAIQSEAQRQQLVNQGLQDSRTIMDSYRAHNGDWDAVLQDVGGKVSLPAAQSLQSKILEMKQNVAKLSDAQLSNLQKTTNQLSDIQYSLSHTPPEQYADAFRNNALTIQKLAPNLNIDPNNPIPQDQLLAHGIGLETQKRYVDEETARRAQQQGQATLEKTQAESDIAQQEAALTPQERANLKRNLPEEERYAADYLAANNLPDTPQNRTLARTKYRTMVPAYNLQIATSTGMGNDSAAVAKQFGMTPDAFDQAAEKYRQTGQMPQMGRGVAGIALQRAIMNRVGQLHPGESLAANSAEYKSNQQSLGKLQTQFDAVSAFENTARANLDQVVQTGAKIPDLSARFANVPVRMISSRMIGTPEMASFQAALLTAQTEAARVLNTANASGVLSDQARKEAQDVLDGNLPYPAMVAAIKQLETDFTNRHQSYAGQIADIQGRLGGATSAAPAQTPKTGGIPTFAQWKQSQGKL